MNTQQRTCLALTGVTAVLMMAFPPFEIRLDSATLNMGYGFLLTPPRQGQIAASVNLGMLVIQWIALGLLSGLACVILRNDTGHSQPPKTGSSSPGTADARTDVPETSLSLNAADREPRSGANPIHPWRRLFARLIDNLLVAATMLIFLATNSGDVSTELGKVLAHPLVGSLFVCALWLPFEIGLLAIFGTTPGKFAFGLRVVSADSSPISLPVAFDRTMFVWTQGLWFGVPLIMVIPQAVAYMRLRRFRRTRWDEDAQCEVTASPWSVWQSLTCVAVVLVTAVLVRLAQGFN